MALSDLSVGDRLGFASLIVAFLGVAVVYLWPDKKIIGWLAFAAAIVLGFLWLWAETRNTLQSVYLISPVRTLFLVGIGGGVLVALLFSLVASNLFVPPPSSSIDERHRYLQADAPDFVASAELFSSGAAPIAPAGRLIIDVTNRPEAQLGDIYNPKAGIFSKPAVKAPTSPPQQHPSAAAPVSKPVDVDLTRPWLAIEGDPRIVEFRPRNTEPWSSLIIDVPIKNTSPNVEAIWTQARFVLSDLNKAEPRFWAHHWKDEDICKPDLWYLKRFPFGITPNSPDVRRVIVKNKEVGDDAPPFTDRRRYSYLSGCLTYDGPLERGPYQLTVIYHVEFSSEIEVTESGLRYHNIVGLKRYWYEPISKSIPTP